MAVRFRAIHDAGNRSNAPEPTATIMGVDGELPEGPEPKISQNRVVSS